MEYGEAINPRTMASAVEKVRLLLAASAEPLERLAEEAVRTTFCCCVVEGEDAAEEQLSGQRRLSGVHKQLIDEVAARARTTATNADKIEPARHPHSPQPGWPDSDRHSEPESDLTKRNA